MASLAQINIRFRADLADFSKQMENVNRTLKTQGQQLQRLGAQMSATFSLAFGALGTAAYNLAADFEDALGASDQIFKDASDDVKEFAENLPTYFGIAKAEILEYSNLMGSMLKNIGQLTDEEASKQSAKLIELAGDLTAMYGGSTQDAVRALTGALKGNNTMLDNYGMAVNNALVKQRAFEMGLVAQGEEMSLAAKQAATLSLIYEQTGDAQGQAAREADGASGSIRMMRTEIKNLTTELGEILLPVITPIIQKIGEMAARFREMNPETQKIVVIVGAVVAAIGPLIAIIGTALTLLPAMTAGIATLGTAFTVLTGPIGLVIAAVGALIAVIAYNWDSVKQAIIDVANYFIDLYNESILVRAGIESIVLVFKTLWERAKFVLNLLGNGFTALWTNIKAGVSGLANVIKAVLTGNFSEIPAIISETFTKVNDSRKKLFDETKKDFNAFADSVASHTDRAIENIAGKRKIAFISADTKPAEKDIKKGVSDATTDGLVDGVANFNKEGAKIKVVPEIGSVAYYDEIIKKLREAQSTQSTDAESFQSFEEQIQAYEDLKNAITDKQLVENSPQWFSERIAQMEEELKYMAYGSDAYDNLIRKITDFKDIQKSFEMKYEEPEVGSIEWYDFHIDGLKKQMEAVGNTTEAYAALRQELEILENSREIELSLNADEVTEKVDSLTEAFSGLGGGIEEVFSSISDSLMSSLGEAENGFERFTQSLLKNVLSIISTALAGAMANAILGATQSAAATGPGAVFTMPGFIAAMSGVVLSAFAAIPKFADGGIVSGPTLGLMGEYPGASSNPEVIAPLNKLKELINPISSDNGSVHVTGDFRINGNDLVLSIDRTVARKKRTF